MTQPKDVIIETWQRLVRLQALDFVSTPGDDSRTGWAGQGRADLRVDPVAPDCLRIIENGRFQPSGNARALAFSNVYRWQWAGDELRLSHERFGVEQPVFLLSLVAAGPDRMTSRAAHLCGADRYAAELRLDDAGFELDWRITGPVKDERLAYRYICDSEVEANI